MGVKMTNKKKLEEMIKKVIKEGKDKLVPYIIKYTYVDFVGKRRAEDRMNWDEKRFGKPTEQSLKKFRDGFNKSMEPGGANSHLASSHSPIGTLTAIDQRTNKVVAKYTPSSFEAI